MVLIRNIYFLYFLKSVIFFLREREENFLGKSSIKIISKLFEANSFKPQSILHIGCSAGFSFPFYQESFQNAKLYGIDPGKESIQIAKEKFSGDGGGRI